MLVALRTGKASQPILRAQRQVRCVLPAQIVGDSPVASALPARLLHHAVVIPLKGSS